MTAMLFAGLLLSSFSMCHAISAVHSSGQSCGAGGNQSCKPLLMFALGPTGSGKSGQEKQLERLFSMRTNQLTVNPPQMLLIDDLVEKDAGYRKNILEYLTQQLGSAPTKAAVDQWLASADQAVYDTFAKNYFGCRRDWGCNRNGTGGCSALFDEIVEHSLTAGKNVIWEQTGKKYPTDDIAQAVATGQNYTIVVGLNALDFCDLKQRNAKRATSSIMKFMNEPENLDHPAPRLPDLRELNKMVDNIIGSLTKIIDCVGKPQSEICTGKIDELYVFDNEHFGFLPSLKIIPPTITDPSALSAFEELKKQAIKMIGFMKSRNCPTSAASEFII